MLDVRVPLPTGTTLTLNGTECIVREPIGFGGSCIAYSADCLQGEYEQSIGVPTIRAVIKEFYPAELSSEIQRDGSVILCADTATFEALKHRFENGAAQQVAYYGADSNHSLPPAKVAAANGTAYSVVSLAQGTILAEQQGQLSLREKADVITSLCNAVAKLHADGKLYLDIKPSNIFLFSREPNETRRIALFDFDTVTSISDLETAVIPYSPDWSPYEQSGSGEWKSEIGYATDVYAIGAVFYWLHSGEKVNSDVLNEIARRRFKFLDSIEDLPQERYLREEIERVLYATLRRKPSQRVQNVEDLHL
jgi:serine/threonine protein kinase